MFYFLVALFLYLLRVPNILLNICLSLKVQVNYYQNILAKMIFYKHKFGQKQTDNQ